MKALKIGVEVEAIGADEEPDTGFLRDIAIYVTPESRLPVLLSGRARFVGRINIKAKQVRMIDDSGCSGMIEG